ncbi:hypothetical protein B1A87_003055 [Arthrobacter sp. KBS0703]|uniref:hypothetical protein n=1 Tax=Arthrobacter sp. KBS0703 TaxID=1955698 RepID=UPI00098FE504|nr:hypothetical protein [Arthrobacter sp. KBS0703]TSE15044.1 hypothetical protein B1A87_003055 [Arthrobacter sp. KBS0703]
MTHQPHIPEHLGQPPAAPQPGYPAPPQPGYQHYSQHPLPYQHPGGPFLPQKPPVSGRRIAAGILGILTSLWAVILAIGTGSVFAPAALIFGLVALSLLTLGIIQIVKSRSRDAGIPLALLGTTAAGMAGALVAAALGLTGGAFVFVALAVFLPVGVLSLLAFLEARASGRNQRHSGGRPR